MKDKNIMLLLGLLLLASVIGNVYWYEKSRPIKIDFIKPIKITQTTNRIDCHKSVFCCGNRTPEQDICIYFNKERSVEG